MFFLAGPVYAQKGKDKPKSNKSILRQNRFKTKSKQGDKAKNKDVAGRRIRQKGKSSANSANRQYTSPYSTKQPRSGGDRAGKPTGRIVQSSPGRANKPWIGNSSGARVSVRSATGKTRNTYPQFGRYSRKIKPRSNQNATSNRKQLSRLKRMQSNPAAPDHKTVYPRSASRAYISKRSTNFNARYIRKLKQGDRAYTKDVAGRKLRQKNYQTPQQPLIQAGDTYRGRKRVGDRSYKGSAGGYVSATRARPKAWRGDITGNKIRGRNFSSKKSVEGQPIFSRKRKPNERDRPYKGTIPGSGARSASQPGEKRVGISPNPVRAPGIGANGIGKYKGNLRRFQAKPSMQQQGAGYTGSIKARKPFKGGGSVSGRRWNNNGTPIQGKTPGIGAKGVGNYKGNLRRFQAKPSMQIQGAGYTGNIKARKPMKGGGSVSGKGWNNNGTPVPVRQPSDQTRKAGRFPGNYKLFDLSPSQRNQGEEYTGSIKARRPAKGGGSVSGKLWNNKETPIPVKQPSDETRKAGSYPGNYKRFDLSPSMRNQGEEFTGTIKLPKFKKSYVQNPNTTDEPIKKKRPTNTTYAVDGLQIPVKRPKYIENPNSADGSLRKRQPSKSTYAVGGLQVKVKEKPYGKKANAAEGALPGIKPTKSSIKAAEYARGVKMNWKYVRNPSSSKDALLTKEPGKAFGKSTDYQGNIKMKKFDLFGKKGLHPDAQFVKTNKNNVKEEKGVVTNFKLWWARLFKKNDTQPDHLKEKHGKPRYDKGEQGMWNE